MTVVLVDTSGDGTFARFGSAAAAGVPRMPSWPAPTGSVCRRARVFHNRRGRAKENSVTGMAVHVGARVMGPGRPGEVLVTSTTRDLTLDSGLAFLEKGAFELKVVPGARTLYAVDSPEPRN
jgi:class 3 adenylate cyclase